MVQPSINISLLSFLRRSIEVTLRAEENCKHFTKLSPERANSSEDELRAFLSTEGFSRKSENFPTCFSAEVRRARVGLMEMS